MLYYYITSYTNKLKKKRKPHFVHIKPNLVKANTWTFMLTSTYKLQFNFAKDLITLKESKSPKHGGCGHGGIVFKEHFNFWESTTSLSFNAFFKFIFSKAGHVCINITDQYQTIVNICLPNCWLLVWLCRRIRKLRKLNHFKLSSSQLSRSRFTDYIDFIANFIMVLFPNSFQVCKANRVKHCIGVKLEAKARKGGKLKYMRWETLFLM